MIQQLLVVWQHKISRLYYHIGQLTYNGEFYTFSYTNEGKGKLQDALANGYMIHPAFLNTNRIYQSETLFAAFDRRIPSPERADYVAILQDLGLPPNASKMAILSETRGKLANDTYSFEHPIIYNEATNQITGHFFVNGMRYYTTPDELAKLSPLTNLLAMRDDQNQVDDNAVYVCTTTGKKLGYVPRFYTEAIASLVQRNLQPLFTIANINPKSHAHWWLKVTITCTLEHDQELITQWKDIMSNYSVI